MTDRTTNMANGHLDLLRVDAVRAGEGTSIEKAHVDSCPACRREVEALEGMTQKLRAAMPVPVEIPQEIENRLLRAYRKAMDEKQRAVRRFAWVRRFAAAGAAAAAVALAVYLPMAGSRRASSEVGRQSEAVTIRDPDDVNGDGNVDILDAYLLARQVEQREGKALDRRGDVERPEVKAVDTLARRVVAL